MIACGCHRSRSHGARDRARRGIEGALGLFFCFASFKLLTSRG